MHEPSVRVITCFESFSRKLWHKMGLNASQLALGHGKLAFETASLSQFRSLITSHCPRGRRGLCSSSILNRFPSNFSRNNCYKGNKLLGLKNGKANVRSFQGLAKKRKSNSFSLSSFFPVLFWLVSGLSGSRVPKRIVIEWLW